MYQLWKGQKWDRIGAYDQEAWSEVKAWKLATLNTDIKSWEQNMTH